MSDTFVTLSYPDHSTYFLDKLWRYYQDKYKVDVEIRLKGQAIFAHQLVLSIFCPKLKDNLDSSLFSTDKLLTVSHVTDDANLLAILFEFMYKGKVSVEEVKLTDLKNAANKLGIDGLIDAIDSIKHDSEKKVITNPKKRGARRRKPAKPVKNVRVRKDVSDEDSLDDVSDDDIFDDDWSDGLEKEEAKPSKRTKVSNKETKKSNDDAGETKEAKSKRASVPKKTKTERKRKWRLEPTLHEKPPETFNCLTCAKNFRNKQSYDRHVKGHNEDSQTYCCDRCNFRSVKKSDLVEHMGSKHMVDLEGNPLAEIKCEQCDYKCHTKQRLKQHILRQHTDKAHKCDKCGYSCVVLYDMARHIRIKHENLRSYQCDICGKGFKTSSAFNSHSRSHSGIKKYVCEICGQEFAKPVSLKFHMMKHEGDKKPFVCDICGKSCRRRDNLQMHLKRIHKINDTSGASLDDTNNSKSTENSEANQTTTLSPNSSAQADVSGYKPPENSVAEQTSTAPTNATAQSDYPGFHNPYFGFVTWMPFSNQ